MTSATCASAWVTESLNAWDYALAFHPLSVANHGDTFALVWDRSTSRASDPLSCAGSGNRSLSSGVNARRESSLNSVVLNSMGKFGIRILEAVYDQGI